MTTPVVPTQSDVSNGMVRLPIDLDDVDQHLSKELESLSFKERSQIQEEIHGVFNLSPQESPEMVDEAIANMEQHLNNIQRKPIYDQLSPFSYLHTKEWKLRFLRCELFDSKKAAERLVRFTEYMEMEYDIEVLERPLTMTDLKTKNGKSGKEIMNSFRSGHTQLFPFRDRSGRRIFVTSANHGLKYKADVRVRWMRPCYFCSLTYLCFFSHIILEFTVQDISISFSRCIQ
jgi:hypothetical protein